jgi:hypothetical protein
MAVGVVVRQLIAFGGSGRPSDARRPRCDDTHGGRVFKSVTRPPGEARKRLRYPGLLYRYLQSVAPVGMASQRRIEPRESRKHRRCA